jgi:hypothetical protein
MAQYLFSVWHLGAYPTLSEQEMAAMYAAVGAFNDMLRDAGALVFACGLEDAASSVVIDGTGAQVTSRPGRIADGPEVLGGFWVIDAPSLAAAHELAAKASAACGVPLEIRPLQDV